ncbi:MAG: hypothetical protein OXS35_03220, partial [Dehalococcoidia bacterium]|nr:hypothetical protein [Dehalococcoidia bacterium]
MKWGSLVKALPIPGISTITQTADGLAGVVDAVRKVTGKSEPADALEAIQANPEQLAELKIRTAELATERLRIVTADLADARRNAPRDRLRTLVGWVTAGVFVLAFCLVGASAIMREPLHDDPVLLQFIGNITGA